MNAILAIIADGRQAIIVIFREAGKMNYFLLFIIDSTKSLQRSMVALSNSSRVGSRGWGTLGQQNHAAGGGNGSIMVGMFVCLCLASQKLTSGSFLFPPERT